MVAKIKPFRHEPGEPGKSRASRIAMTHETNEAARIPARPRRQHRTGEPDDAGQPLPETIVRNAAPDLAGLIGERRDAAER